MKKLLWILPLLIVLAVAAWAGHFLLHFPKAIGEQPLRVLSWNVHGLHDRYDHESKSLIIESILLANPDVVLLQEYPMRHWGLNPESALALRGNLQYVKHYRYADGMGKSATMGLAILSRYPIKGSWQEILRPLGEGRLVGVSTLDVEGREIHLAVVHMPNSDIRRFGIQSSEIFGTNLRTIQTQHLLQSLDSLRHEPLVVAGDFNSFPYSASWRMMNYSLRDAFPFAELFTPTYTVEEGIGVRLDHIFVTPKVEVKSAQVLKLEGSDHLPVIADLVF